MKDKILLNHMEFYGYHGLFPEEKKLGQRFIVDVTLYTPSKKAATTDDMNDSIDYGEVFHIVEEIVEGGSQNLIEAVAQSIADNLLAAFSKLDACLVKVTKPDPPIKGNYDSVAVEIYREQNR